MSPLSKSFVKRLRAGSEGLLNNFVSAAQSVSRGIPAGLHGDCTELGLICGTRPDELIKSLVFTAFDWQSCSECEGREVFGMALAFCVLEVLRIIFYAFDLNVP